MTATKEYATVTTACEVSFQVGRMNYGTINIPVGAKVFRHIVKSRDAAWKPETVKTSDWFVMEVQKYCPEGCMLNGKPSDFFIHDADHYGITMPNANVRKDDAAVAKHKAIHY